MWVFCTSAIPFILIIIREGFIKYHGFNTYFLVCKVLTHIMHNSRNIPTTLRTHLHQTPHRDQMHTVLHPVHRWHPHHLWYRNNQPWLSDIIHQHNAHQFTIYPTLESNGYINFLDLTIIRSSMHIETDIYRKPTTTDTTIHFTSTHHNEHKLAAYRYHIERMLNLPLKTVQQKKRMVNNLSRHPTKRFPTHTNT